MTYRGLSSHLKDQFLIEFSPAERLYFLKTAKEAIFKDKYVPGEDLYHYCYFLTQKKRLESMIDPASGGLVRYLAVEARKDIEDAIKIYKTRLDENRQLISSEECDQFLRYLGGPA